MQGASGAAAAAEDHYQQALGWARRQRALSWELRAATSLARLLREQHRSTEAIALLAPIYNRFTEGFDIPDLKATTALIGGFYNSKDASRSPLMDAPPQNRGNCRVEPRDGAASTSIKAASMAHSAGAATAAGRSWVNTKGPIDDGCDDGADDRSQNITRLPADSIHNDLAYNKFKAAPLRCRR